ncbi:hypothetical protein [Candidatus Thiodiazotropha endoloripes]|nr:hypothetical protein [Candidatus Thiodiazotropha endoloripes]MCG7983771.1 hypothetical protein [Candidatus Thiodiazotropha lotti]
MNAQDVLDTIFLMRGLERLWVVVFGGVSIVLGWHLFKLNATRKTDGTFKWGDMVVELRGAAPGIFFAAFGSFVLYGAITSPLKITPDALGVLKAANNMPSQSSTETPVVNPAIAWIDSVQQRSDSWSTKAKHDAFNGATKELLILAEEACGENVMTCRLNMLAKQIEYYKNTVIMPTIFSEEIITLAKREVDPSTLPTQKKAQLERLNMWLDTEE